MKKIVTFFTVFFLLSMNTLAASCSVSDEAELKQKAANVKVSYEVANEEMKFEDRKGNLEYFKITLLNVTKDVYVIMKSGVEDDLKLTYNHSNNGAIEYEWYYIDRVTNFTFEVYASDETNCTGKLYNTIYLTTPRYNEFYNVEACQDNSEFYLCKKYVNFDNISEAQFQTKLTSYKKGEISDTGEEINPTLFDKIFNFINEYKWFIISGTALIVIGVTLVINKKNKKSRELGL